MIDADADMHAGVDSFIVRVIVFVNIEVRFDCFN